MNKNKFTNTGDGAIRVKAQYDGTSLKKNDEEKEYTTPGKPEVLYNADGDTVRTNDIDNGNLSEAKKESGTNRKYVEYLEGPKEGGRLYYSNPK